MGWLVLVFGLATVILACRLTIAGREIDRLNRMLERRRIEHAAEVEHLHRPVYRVDAINRRFDMIDFEGRGDDCHWN